MTYVMQLPGFGVITGMTVLAAIGEVQRFESAKRLASYSGLTGGLDQSGIHLVQKGITKEWRKELRWALVEVAQRAVKSDPRWTRKFQELHKRTHRNQAIVATPAPTAGAVLLGSCWNWSGMCLLGASPTATSLMNGSPANTSPGPGRWTRQPEMA
jgi:transposase